MPFKRGDRVAIRDLIGSPTMIVESVIETTDTFLGSSDQGPEFIVNCVWMESRPGYDTLRTESFSAELLIDAG